MTRQIKGIHSLGCLLVPSVILTLSLGALPAFAGKPDCNVDSSHSSCKPDDSGGDGTMTLVPITAQWTGDVAEDPARGDCNAEYASVATGGVAYTCPNAGTVHAKLGTADAAAGMDGAELFRLLSDLKLGGANEIVGASRITSYFLSHDSTWNDGACVDGTSTCLVMSAIWAYFDDWCNNSKCGRLVIFRGWGNVDPAADGDLNPFSDDQEIVLDELEVTFKGIGKNRDVATCSYTFAESSPITVHTYSPAD